MACFIKVINAHCSVSSTTMHTCSLILRTVVLNSKELRIDPKNGIQNFGISKTHFIVGFTQKSTKMHWYDYNNTVPLLNKAKTRIFHLVYNFF